MALPLAQVKDAKTGGSPSEQIHFIGDAVSIAIKAEASALRTAGPGACTDAQELRIEGM